MEITIYTIGHSTHPIEEFIKIMKSFEIRQVVDVRTIPRSRHNPQFNEEALKNALSASDISYCRIAGLGGLRHTRKDSINKAWKNASFRGFADYMQTEEFKNALEALIDLAKEKSTVIMCAEAVPWRCHRSLIGDALLVRGIQVQDIFAENSGKAHLLTAWAKVDGINITYPEMQRPLSESGNHSD